MSQPEKDKPPHNHLKVVHAGQGVAKKPRILVVDANSAIVDALFERYENAPENFHGCELVPAKTTNAEFNAKYVLDPANKIDGVVTGLSTKGRHGAKDDYYGLDLTKLIGKSKPVVVSWLGGGVDGDLEKATNLDSRQRMLREAGALGIKEPGDLRAFEAVAEAVATQNRLGK